MGSGVQGFRVDFRGIGRTIWGYPKPYIVENCMSTPCC